MLVNSIKTQVYKTFYPLTVIFKKKEPLNPIMYVCACVHTRTHTHLKSPSIE